MYVIAGVTGHVGSVAADTLLAAGLDVRVLVRRQSDQHTWEAKGAQTRLVTLEDEASLTDALLGSSGFFALLPFDLGVSDLTVYAGTITASIVGAVTRARVPHVVLLSSGGADLEVGTGPVAGLHMLEEGLRDTGAILTALRSGHFQEKVADVLELARATGQYPVFASSADVRRPMTATADLGAQVAHSLRHPPAHSEVVDVLGPWYSEREVAALLGDALGRALDVIPVPESEWRSALEGAGFSPYIAESLAELYRADEQGHLEPRGDRSVTVSTDLSATIALLLAAPGGC